MEKLTPTKMETASETVSMDRGVLWEEMAALADAQLMLEEQGLWWILKKKKGTHLLTDGASARNSATVTRRCHIEEVMAIDMIALVMLDNLLMMPLSGIARSPTMLLADSVCKDSKDHMMLALIAITLVEHMADLVGHTVSMTKMHAVELAVRLAQYHRQPSRVSVAPRAGRARAELGLELVVTVAMRGLALLLALIVA